MAPKFNQSATSHLYSGIRIGWQNTKEFRIQKNTHVFIGSLDSWDNIIIMLPTGGTEEQEFDTRWKGFPPSPKH